MSETERQSRKVVVIGAGLGGISAAISLATEGYDVTLLEKNAQIGGKLNVKTLDGFSFDLGPSIIILPHLFARLFENAGKRMEDYVQLEELPLQWRSFFEDGLTIDLHSDMRVMERELEKLGEDAAGYYDFVEYSRRLYKFAEVAYLERGSDTVKEIISGHGLREVLSGTDIFTTTMDKGVGRFIRHPRLRDMLNFFVKYVGSSSYDAPALLNLLAYSQLGYGLWYVSGGMYNLARGYGRLLEELGVKVRLNSEVTRIDKEGNRVLGVTLSGGERVVADVIVSNMEVLPAYKQLLGHSGGLMMRRYEYQYEPAASGLVVHLGVEGSYEQLAHHNFFFSQDPKEHFAAIHRRKELPEDPTIYLVCPTKSDPKLAPEGHEIIKILPHIPYVQDEPYTEADYEALEQRVYDKLERMGLKGLRERTVVKDVLTPDDIQRMYYSNRGSIYGVVADWKRNYALKAPKQSERYENLFFVGGSVNPGGGTPMVVLSGQQAAKRIVERFPPRGGQS